MSVGRLVLERRAALGHTQAQVAQECGVSVRTVVRWESGAPPHTTALAALARYLGISVQDLIPPVAP